MRQIITSLLDTDQYKFTMLQLFLHQYPDAMTEWAYKCRNKEIRFTKEMVEEINHQIDLYCSLHFTEEELAYMSKTPWYKPDFINFLRLWRPIREQITCSLNEDGTLNLRAKGPNINVSPYETPLLAIVSEVYYKMNFSEEGYEKIVEDFYERFSDKARRLYTNEYSIGAFSEFGMRRRISKGIQYEVVKRLAKFQETHSLGNSTFVGTSNVWLAKEFGIKAVGTMAHECFQTIGQGYPEFNPAYSNKRVLESWVKEYGILNGIALTDCITTDCFLLDFNTVYATLFSGVRHDSGDPYVWGNKIIEHYKKLGIDPSSKTLLFSDSLDFERATQIYNYFKGKTKVAFGIGTYLVNDTYVPALNEVMKVVKANGHNVAKISDTDGKNMCESPEYIKYLKDAIQWRLWGK